MVSGEPNLDQGFRFLSPTRQDDGPTPTDPVEVRARLVDRVGRSGVADMPAEESIVISRLPHRKVPAEISFVRVIANGLEPRAQPFPQSIEKGRDADANERQPEHDASQKMRDPRDDRDHDRSSARKASSDEEPSHAPRAEGGDSVEDPYKMRRHVRRIAAVMGAGRVFASEPPSL